MQAARPEDGHEDYPTEDTDTDTDTGTDTDASPASNGERGEKKKEKSATLNDDTAVTTTVNGARGCAGTGTALALLAALAAGALFV